MNEVRVSVVMITYGHERFIAQAIEGVLMQVCNFSVELIIANDNSPDKTDDIIQSFLANRTIPPHITIHYTKHSTNLGMMPNFIWALKRAKGQYIALCEGDDYWTKANKLQIQVDFMESHPDYIMCCHDRDVVDDNNEVLIHNQQTTKVDKDTFVQSLVYRNVPFDDVFYTYFVKAKNGDTFLIYRLHQLGETKYFDLNAACYRVSDAGVWSQVGAQKRFEMSMASYNNMIDYYMLLQNRTAVQELQKWKAEQYLIRSQDLAVNGDQKAALNSLWQYNKTLWKHNPAWLFKLATIKTNILLTVQYLKK